MKEPDQDRELRRLLEAYFDGRLTPAETEELGRRLLADPEARRAYWDEAHWHSALSVWGEQAAGQQDVREASGAVPEGDGGEAPGAVGEGASAGAALRGGGSARRWRWAVAALALAACLALVFVAGRHRPAESSQVAAAAPAALGHLTYMNDAVWSEASPVDDDLLVAGAYELERGVVRFETTAGAVVTVAAPAQFNFLAADRIVLGQGRLTARMLREEANLTVRVGDMEVRDLGTAFGIDANDGSRTLVSVFDGAVAVTDAGHQGPAQQVVEGQSLIGRHQGRTVFESAAYSAEAFRDLWPLTVGINDASRLVEFLPPGPLLRPLRTYRANDRIYLFPEQRNAVTTRPLPIDLSGEVRAWPESPASPYPLAPGTRVNSYLVFFQPEPAMHGVRRLHGSITFQQRIVAVMCSDQGLTESDAMLGDPKADYATTGRRGLEELDKVNLRSIKLPHDSIRIGPDGRTIQFDFYVIDEREQMRVLVAAD